MTFCAADREQVAEAGAAEVLLRLGVDALVLAEHEAAGERRLARRHAPAEAGLGAGADLVGAGEGERRAARRSPTSTGSEMRAVRIAAPQGCRRARSASIVAGPMPEIWSSWSTEARPPCSSRNSTMSAAVTGPMPSIVSSCSTRGGAEADRAVLGAAAPPRRRRRPGRVRDDHLLAVGEPGGEVDRFQLPPRARRRRPARRRR